MRSLSELIWWRFPRAIARRLPALGQMLGDGGGWLRAWPQVGVAAPAIALVLGLVIGLTHAPSTEIFADSLPLFATLTAVSLIGGGLGAAAWIGYVVGDLLYGGRTWVQPNFVDHLIHERAGQLIVYLVLFVGVVALPYAITQLRRQTVATLPRGARGASAEALVQAAIGAGVIAGWVTVLPFVVMPFFLWRGSGGPTETILSLRQNWWLFALIGVVAGIGRVVLERRASRLDPAIPVDWSVSPNPSPSRMVLGIVGGAAVGTALLAGMVQTWVDALIVVGGLLIAGAVRAWLMPGIGALGSLVERIPIVVRILVIAGAAYGITNVALQSQQGVIVGDSYLGLLVAILAAILLGAVLLPSTPPSPQHSDRPPARQLPEILRVLGLPVLLSLLAGLISPDVARADDCSGAFDCFQTMSAGALAAAAAAGVGGLLYAVYGKGGAVDRSRERTADMAARDAKRSEPTHRPSERSGGGPVRTTITRPDGSRTEITHRPDGAVEHKEFGPPTSRLVGDEMATGTGRLEGRTVTDATGRTEYGPGGEELRSTEQRPDGTYWTRVPTGDGGYTGVHFDAQGREIETGVSRPDGSYEYSHRTEGGTETTRYRLGPSPTSTVTTTSEGSVERFWELPPE